MRVSPWLRYHSTAVVKTIEEALSVVRFLKPKTVYLCGGINGLSDAACKDWRAVARDFFLPPGEPWKHETAILDPMARDYRGREDECVNEIVNGDKVDILASDVVLVNATRPSWGTAMEVIFAHMLGKKVVSFVGE